MPAIFGNNAMNLIWQIRKVMPKQTDCSFTFGTRVRHCCCTDWSAHTPGGIWGGRGGGVEVGLGHIVALNLAAATQNAQSSRKHLSLLSMMHKPS